MFDEKTIQKLLVLPKVIKLFTSGWEEVDIFFQILIIFHLSFEFSCCRSSFVICNVIKKQNQ